MLRVQRGRGEARGTCRRPFLVRDHRPVGHRGGNGPVGLGLGDFPGTGEGRKAFPPRFSPFPLSLLPPFPGRLRRPGFLPGRRPVGHADSGDGQPDQLIATGRWERREGNGQTDRGDKAGPVGQRRAEGGGTGEVGNAPRASWSERGDGTGGKVREPVGPTGRGQGKGRSVGQLVTKEGEVDMVGREGREGV